ncbi:MAG: tRNA(Met) cytidine acetyltransferase TmcA [Halapricum sp.]
MNVAASLVEESRACNERRVLVLAGTPEHCRKRAAQALDAASIARESTTVVGPEPFLDCEHREVVHASDLLGRTREAIVYDAHEQFRPNALGQLVGAVDGGGLLLLLTPSLDEWPDRRDAFDETLAVPPFGIDDVTGRFRARVVETLRTHRGVAVVDADTGTVENDGLTHPTPRLARPEPTLPTDHEFPTEAYEVCLSQDQVDVLHELEALAEPGGTVVVEADRGRGKSSAAGLAAASLAIRGADVLVTAPQYGRASEVFARARDLLTVLNVDATADRETAPHEMDIGDGRIRFAPPTSAAEQPGEPDVVLVDEAAALPVRLLERFLDAPSVAFTTTIHGYEGAGRGFSVRFKDRLDESEREVREATMREPIRYAAGDPVEVWATRALLLDASPAVEPLVEESSPESVVYERLDSARLADDEHLLREVFGLLVLAHYRTEPDDLARLLDAPNVSVRALTHAEHVVSVALLAREGGLSAERRADMYAGGRVRGNMLPDVLTTQLRDEDAGIPVGWRVVRIATHHAARQRGMGSLLLDRIVEEAGADRDYLGVGYGATPELLAFWSENDFHTVHLSTTRNERSGEHSAIMLRPLSDRGERLHDRHAAWFLGRVSGMLSDPLDDVDPDVVRATLAAVEPTAPLSLLAWDWRLLAGSPHGAGLFDTAPDTFRALALHALTDADGPDLEPREARLLVRKVLQGQEWDHVTAALGYVSRRACMRALGDITGRLVATYGTDEAREELVRFE